MADRRSPRGSADPRGERLLSLLESTGQALVSSRSRWMRSTNRSSIARASAVPTQRIRSRYLWRSAGVLFCSAVRIVSIIVSHSPTLFGNTHNIGAAVGVLHDRAGYYSTTQSDYMFPRRTDLRRAGSPRPGLASRPRPLGPPGRSGPGAAGH